MKTLLHACCAPCSIKCIDSLRAEGIEPVLFWYNPNIHPFTEYENRLLSLKRYASENELELVTKDEYGLRNFIQSIYPNFDERCLHCYETRLEVASRFAAEHGYSNFTTTLLISPYQNHALLKEISERLAQKYGISFMYKDFRPLFREGQHAAREYGLYMQKYCGCIFSEEERYKSRKII